MPPLLQAPVRRAVLNYFTYNVSLSPLAYWRLGEPSGTLADDAVGANDGTYVNAPSLATAGLLGGVPDTAVTFDGSTNYVSTAMDLSAIGTGDFCVSLLYQPIANNRDTAEYIFSLADKTQTVTTDNIFLGFLPSTDVGGRSCR